MYLISARVVKFLCCAKLIRGLRHGGAKMGRLDGPHTMYQTKIFIHSEAPRSG